MGSRRAGAVPVGYCYPSWRGTCCRRWGSRGPCGYVSCLPGVRQRMGERCLTAVGFIVLAVAIATFFCLSTVHPPRKEIAVLSLSVCTYPTFLILTTQSPANIPTHASPQRRVLLPHGRSKLRLRGDILPIDIQRDVRRVPRVFAGSRQLLVRNFPSRRGALTPGWPSSTARRALAGSCRFSRRNGSATSTSTPALRSLRRSCSLAGRERGL